ncbi:MAG: tRNA glutamyl-Q(34) synthetase GluQRS [Steroidobacteraceae bacterium]|nr:tRNA glutamyl-Q(34) synthetase GluQRS [Steroidobacteraceae bacterium]
MNVAKSSSATATTGTVEAPSPYRGRFAPSPTGTLHFGSLVAAVASFLDARAAGGQWLVRIEDLDPPRERPGAADEILFTLHRLGLGWDGPVLRQSTRCDAYSAALEQLRRDGRIRDCCCARAALAALPQNARRAPGDDLFHPPACISRPAEGRMRQAFRFRVPDHDVEFRDRVQGTVRIDVGTTVGDFVLRRKDGLYAYQLAVVVDDEEQGITHVVRGADLLQSTPRQILLQRALGLRGLEYMHVPLAVNASGLKLSKSSDAPGLAAASSTLQIVAALEFLGQDPPEVLKAATADEVLAWGVSNWHPERFAGVASATAPA